MEKKEIVDEEERLDDEKEEKEDYEDDAVVDEQPKESAFRGVKNWVKRHKTPIIAGITTIIGVVSGIALKTLAEGSNTEEHDNAIELLPAELSENMSDDSDDQEDDQEVV